MKPGTQIAYVPNHAWFTSLDHPQRTPDLQHRDVEFGFVTSEHNYKDAHWCRFWIKGQPGVLRTTNTSEKTPNDNLVEHVSTDQAHVDALLAGIQAQRAMWGG